MNNEKCTNPPDTKLQFNVIKPDEWTSKLRDREEPPPFTRKTGPLVDPLPDGPDVTPEGLFDYLWPESLWDLLVLETNR
jgi:hypothetical protein